MSDAASIASADVLDADATSAELVGLQAEPRHEAASKNDRRFYAGLALAFALHSLLFAGFYGSPPRYVGDPEGSKEAISVALVTDAELRSLSTTPDATPKGSPVPPPAPTEVVPTPEPPVSPSPPAAQAPQPAPAPAPEATVADDALTLKPIDDPPPPTQQQSEAKPVEPTKTPPEPPEPPTKRTKPDRSRSAALDLSPPVSFSAPSGGGAGLQRPPGITRSGENDAFARAVVSALQRTMPQLSDARGRVTVRITLDMDGSIVSTQVVHPSNIAGLDRSVVFATRQTSYPFPPRNARSADLVFLITYIYQ